MDATSNHWRLTCLSIRQRVGINTAKRERPTQRSLKPKGRDERFKRPNTGLLGRRESNEHEFTIVCTSLCTGNSSNRLVCSLSGGLMEPNYHWRVGRKVGRTIYIQKQFRPSTADELIGLMDTKELAEFVCRCVNYCVDKGVYSYSLPDHSK